ncbi:MAG: hypothetical protein GWO24_35750 [Akkermansiaceae bacterium]|nr:hypothetical protein [Akkermansiaceae bacterium]
MDGLRDTSIGSSKKPRSMLNFAVLMPLGEGVSLPSPGVGGEKNPSSLPSGLNP